MFSEPIYIPWAFNTRTCIGGRWSGFTSVFTWVVPTINLHPAGWPVLWCEPIQVPCVSHSQHRKKSGEVLEKMQVNGGMPVNTGSLSLSLSLSLVVVVVVAFLCSWIIFWPHSGELRTQKLKSHLVRTQSLNVLPLKPGVGQYIAIHATITARNFVPCLFLHFWFIHLHFFQNLSWFFPVLAVTNTWFLCRPAE